MPLLLTLAWRNLFHGRPRFVATLIGIVFAIVLVMVQLGLCLRFGRMAAKTGSFPRQLSGGEHQRVAIARAIVAEPPAVLADEPTAALDGATGQSIMQILVNIAKTCKRAVLMVTHDTRLTGFADDTIFIEDGRLKNEALQRSGHYAIRGGA
jgi:predicted ABC-type transport system involved in lysophospholipase L1 biosynthesis ATPase subunit